MKKYKSLPMKRFGKTEEGAVFYSLLAKELLHNRNCFRGHRRAQFDAAESGYVTPQNIYLRKSIQSMKTIGIIGGGQLGRMMTQAAKKMGFAVTVLDPGENPPAGQVADKQIVGPGTTLKS